jgi:hypothetical protein
LNLLDDCWNCTLSRIIDTIVISCPDDSDDMNHDNDDVMITSLYYAFERNDTVVHDDGTIDRNR